MGFRLRSRCRYSRDAFLNAMYCVSCLWHVYGVVCVWCVLCVVHGVYGVYAAYGMYGVPVTRFGLGLAIPLTLLLPSPSELPLGFTM